MPVTVNALSAHGWTPVGEALGDADVATADGLADWLAELLGGALGIGDTAAGLFGAGALAEGTLVGVPVAEVPPPEQPATASISDRLIRSRLMIEIYLVRRYLPAVPGSKGSS